MSRRGHKFRGHWPEAKKIELVKTYILLGDLRFSAATLGIPEVTARVWKTTEWWRQTELECRRTTKLQLSTKLSDIINKSLQVLNERLDNGDHVYDQKTRSFIRKPVSAEHANKITAQLIDRTLMLEKTMEVEQIDKAGLEARLTKLKEEMINFAKKSVLAKSVNEKEVIDVDSSGGEVVAEVKRIEGPPSIPV